VITTPSYSVLLDFMLFSSLCNGAAMIPVKSLGTRSHSFGVSPNIGDTEKTELRNILLASTLCCGFSLGNFISTAEKIRLPDDCTIGYIIEALLEVTLTHTHLFHSHLENLQKLPADNVLDQVSGAVTTSHSCTV